MFIIKCQTPANLRAEPRRNLARHRPPIASWPRHFPWQPSPPVRRRRPREPRTVTRRRMQVVTHALLWTLRKLVSGIAQRARRGPIRHRLVTVRSHPLVEVGDGVGRAVLVERSFAPPPVFTYHPGSNLAPSGYHIGGRTYTLIASFLDWTIPVVTRRRRRRYLTVGIAPSGPSCSLRHLRGKDGTPRDAHARQPRARVRARARRRRRPPRFRPPGSVRTGG